MIVGNVRNREAIIDLEVTGPSQPPQQIEAVIDTGYNGDLTLPSHLVRALQLPFAGHRRGALADGSIVILDVHLATIIWHGRQQDVLVSRTEGAPLIGMSLLRGSRLIVDVMDGGNVIINELQ